MNKVVIKLGGSLITKKETESFPVDIEEIKRTGESYIRLDVIKRLGEELKSSLQKNSRLELIIINGGGPFGHYLAKNQHLLSDIKIIHESVKYLNEKVVSILRETRYPFESIAPFDYCVYNGNDNFDIENLWQQIILSLKQRKMPSTYGDIVPVIEGVKGKYDGYEIISGEDLGTYFAEQWNADIIVVLADVDGLFDENNKLIKKVKPDQGFPFLLDTVRNDATGSMFGKVKKLQDAARNGISSIITSGLKEGNLEKIISGKKVKGTLITQ